MKRLLFIFTLIAALTIDLSAQEIGQPAPDFSLGILDGGTFTLSENTNKVVLIFVFGYSCHLCEISAPKVQSDLINSYLDEEDFLPIGIDIWDGSATGVENFRDGTGLNIPLLMMGSNFASEYNSSQDRLIIVDKSGKLVFKPNSGATGVFSQARTAIDNALEEEITVTALNDREQGITSLTLSPNPVVSQSFLSFNLIESGEVNVSIHSLDGRLVLNAYNGFLQTGEQNVSLDLNAINQGMYFAKVSMGQDTQIIQLIKN